MPAIGFLPSILLSLRSLRYSCSHKIHFSGSTISSKKTLKDVLAEIIPKEKDRVDAFRKAHGAEKVGDVTIDMIYGGMRGITGLVTETSVLDSEGIKFRGLTINECLKQLPKALSGDQILPESMLFFLMTGYVPTVEQVKAISSELVDRGAIPPHVTSLLSNLPGSVHPIAQLVMACSALTSESKFGKAYSSGVSKNDYWSYVYEDSMDLIAKLPTIAALIYNHTFRDGQCIAPLDSKADWSMNFSRMLGFDDPLFTDFLRLYIVLHSDHEGGNVSAHACHLVGSGLADPYFSFAASMCGLVGHLHGRAAENVLKWIDTLVEKFGITPSDEEVVEFIHSTITSKQVIPGFGHAVLKYTDPRYTVNKEFALKHLPNDPYVKIALQCYKLVPEYLLKLDKVSNPWPNVDAITGVIFNHFGMKERRFHPVLFGVSRALGVLSSLVWDRALGLPIERPKSLTTECLMKIVSSRKA